MKRFLCLLGLLTTAMAAYSQAIIYGIYNCNGEKRTVTYSNQMIDVLYAARGVFQFKDARQLTFSPNSKVKLEDLDKAAVTFRKAFPKNYWDQMLTPTVTLDNRPNENGKIWCESVLVDDDRKGHVKVLGAIRVIFAGDDATKERVHPKIEDIILITDKKELKRRYDHVTQLKIAAKRKTPPPGATGPVEPPPIRD